MKIGSLCTGYGGLDLAVEEHFAAETVWCAEFDKFASQVIEQRFGVPNFGDITKIDWHQVEPVDIITAGYPCQPFSHAGNRKGTNDPRHIWPHIAKGISILRPKFVILENVKGHLSLGLKEVLEDLASLGYDAEWRIVRASDVGAPHQRARVYIVANAQSWGSGFQPIGDETQVTEPRNYNSTTTDTHSRRQQIQATGQLASKQQFASLSNQGAISDTYNKHQSHNRQMSELGCRFIPRREMHLQTAPDVLDKQGRLNAEFVEYMMGLTKGWVTDCGLSRAQTLKMLGNGVVPQQAKLALELMT